MAEESYGCRGAVVKMTVQATYGAVFANKDLKTYASRGRAAPLKSTLVIFLTEKHGKNR